MDEREILLFVHCKARQLTNHHLPGYFALILRYDCMGRVKYGTNESIIGSKEVMDKLFWSDQRILNPGSGVSGAMTARGLKDTSSRPPKD